MENTPVNPNTSSNNGGPVITHGSGHSSSGNPANRNTDNTQDGVGLSKNWADIEQSVTAKAQELESRTRGYIIQSPMKALMTVGTFAMVLGYLVSKIRA